MNSDRDNHPKLPLPKPRSPKHLDDKVLAYAKANAPKKSFTDSRQWMSTIAFAGIVGIAVLIAVPSYQPPAKSPAGDGRSAVELAKRAQTDVAPRQHDAKFDSINSRLENAIRANSLTEPGANSAAESGAKSSPKSEADSLKIAPPPQSVIARSWQQDTARTAKSRVYSGSPPVVSIDSDAEAREGQRISTTSEPQPTKEHINSGRSKLLPEERIISAYKRVDSTQSRNLMRHDPSTAGASNANETAAAGILNESDQRKAIQNCTALAPAPNPATAAIAAAMARPAQSDPNEPVAAKSTAADRELAEDCYQTLLERCTECELPKSLAEARRLISE